MPPNFKQRFGLLRSLFIYYGIPFRGNRLVQLYQPFIKPGDLCFDIGAHVGNRLRAFSQLGARVVALEPQPYMMNFLQRWYGRNKDIILLQVGAGAHIGKTTMYVSDRTPTVTSLSESWIGMVQKDESFSNVTWDNTLPIQLTTLDRLIQDYGMPTFCKIDVEGYELEVLRGLTQPIPILSFEFIPVALQLAHACIRKLSDLGNYQFNWSMGESHKMSSQMWLSTIEMLRILDTNLYEKASGDIYARLIGNQK